jgi:hypothetical protein
MTMKCSLLEQIGEMARRVDLSTLERDTLKALASEPNDLKAIWHTITKGLGGEADLLVILFWASFFAREIVSARQIAAKADVQPDYLSAADKAEELYKFLSGSDFLPPYPAAGTEFMAMLKDLAQGLRDVHRRSLVHVSREDVDGSRERAMFMRLMSHSMRECFKKWFDAEVAQITNILFPDAMTTIDSVRAARRPRTRKERSLQAAIAV